MKHTKLLITIVVAASLLTACSNSLLHRLDQQQGNLVTEQMIKQLKPGMDREQVLFIMGQPVLRNSFDSDRWDYIYTFAPKSRSPEKRFITLYFDEDRLNRLVGNHDLLGRNFEDLPEDPEELEELEQAEQAEEAEKPRGLLTL